MLHKIFGIVLIVDGISSLILPIDKHWRWQVGRCIRIFIGIMLIVIR